MQSVKVFNRRDVDELVLLDISATPEGREPDYDQIATLAQECFVPLAVGGGVSSVESIRRLLRIGADKTSINTHAYVTPALIEEAAALFGSQCVVVAIDYRRLSDGRLECFSRCGTHPTGHHPVEWARTVEKLGAGEIHLTSIERDGLMQGYDVDVLRQVCSAVSIPVIASGGAGTYEHMREAVQDAGAAAVSAASLYLFTNATPLEAKAYLSAHGVPVRSHHTKMSGRATCD
jgi:cyclase